MIEKIRPVSNPLTIIAIFAALAEIAGTAVLVVVNVEIQRIFVWFVMGFPTALILAFFVTLNFNRVALYAPRDYNNDGSFLELMSRGARLKAELAAARRIASDLLKKMPAERIVAESRPPESLLSTPDPAMPVVPVAPNAGALARLDTLATALSQLKALAGHLQCATDAVEVIEASQACRAGDRVQQADLRRRVILRIVVRALPARLSAQEIAAEMQVSSKTLIVLLSSMMDEGLLIHRAGYAATNKGMAFLDRFGSRAALPAERKAGGT